MNIKATRVGADKVQADVSVKIAVKWDGFHFTTGKGEAKETLVVPTKTMLFQFSKLAESEIKRTKDNVSKSLNKVESDAKLLAGCSATARSAVLKIKAKAFRS